MGGQRYFRMLTEETRPNGGEGGAGAATLNTKVTYLPQGATDDLLADLETGGGGANTSRFQHHSKANAVGDAPQRACNS